MYYQKPGWTECVLDATRIQFQYHCSCCHQDTNWYHKSYLQWKTGKGNVKIMRKYVQEFFIFAKSYSLHDIVPSFPVIPFSMVNYHFEHFIDDCFCKGISLAITTKRKYQSSKNQWLVDHFGYWILYVAWYAFYRSGDKQLHWLHS